MDTFWNYTLHHASSKFYFVGELITIRTTMHLTPLNSNQQGASIMLTLATDISATTVYSLNVLVPMKWYKVFPLHEKRDVPSGITPLP